METFVIKLNLVICIKLLYSFVYIRKIVLWERVCMNENIFRKQSIDRISSPEQLTDYIKVSNPSVWIILIAIVVLLAAVLVWSVFGTLPTTLKVNGYVQDGIAVCYVDSQNAAKLKEGMAVQLGEAAGTVTEVSKTPVSTQELSKIYDDDYTVSSLMVGDWNYPVQVNASGVPDGLCEMVITIDSVKPVSFILN